MPLGADRRSLPGALLATLVTLTSLGLLLAPVLRTPRTLLLGSADSEAPAHIHWLAASLAGLGRHGPFTLSASPSGLEATDALMDPASLLILAPVSALAGGGLEGFTLGWNLLPAAGLLISALGAWLWARAWLGDEDPGAWGAGVAASLAACSLWALHQVEVGRSECFLYPAFALHGALLFAALRRGGAWRWCGAAASLLPLIGCGLSTLPLLAVVELAVLSWGLRRERLRPALTGLGALAALAVAATIPLLLALRAHPPPSMDHLDSRVPGPSVALETLLLGRGDLLLGLPGYEVSPWLGWAAVIGLILAAWRWRPARRPALLALALLWVCAGPWPSLAGHRVPAPAALLEALPGPLGLVRGWVRLLGLLVPVVAVIAGAAAVRRPWIALPLAALALGEVALRDPARSTMSLHPPARAGVLEAGGTRSLELPRDRMALARRALIGASDPDPWDPRIDARLLATLDRHAGNLPQQFDRDRPAAPSDDALPDLRRRMAKLRELGVDGVLLREHSLVPGARDRAAALLDAIACRPTEGNPNHWSLPRGEEAQCGPDPAEEAPVGRRRSLGDPI